MTPQDRAGFLVMTIHAVGGVFLFLVGSIWTRDPKLDRWGQNERTFILAMLAAFWPFVILLCPFVALFYGLVHGHEWLGDKYHARKTVKPDPASTETSKRYFDD